MQTMEEIFKDIEGYEGLYQVSNLGNVKNLKTGRILKQQLHKGYWRVGLRKDNKKKTYSTHRLVAIAFVENPNPEKFDIINHKDENKANCRWDNLEWCDLTYNLNYGTIKERQFNTRMKNQEFDETYIPNLSYKERRKLSYERHKETNKDYYQKHREERLEYQRNYNKQKKLEKNNWFAREFESYNRLMEKIN